MKKRNNKSVLCKTNFFNNKCFQVKDTPDKFALYGYGLSDKPNAIARYLKGTHPEDSTLCRTRESVITNRVREMKEILSNIEKNIDNFSKEKLAGKLLEILKTFLIEISDTEQHFKHNDELEEKEKLIESLKEEIITLKKFNTSLSESIKEANKKKGIVESLNQLLKSSNENLKKKTEELRLRLTEAKNKLAQIIEVGLSEKVAEELDELFKENQYLRQIMASFSIDLKKSRAREKILLSVVKEKGEMTKSLEERLKEVQVGEIEVGKNKVKIPILDLSVLQYSPSSDGSEESTLNQLFKSDGNYKKHSLKICQSLNDKK